MAFYMLIAWKTFPFLDVANDCMDREKSFMMMVNGAIYKKDHEINEYSTLSEQREAPIL